MIKLKRSFFSTSLGEVGSIFSSDDSVRKIQQEDVREKVSGSRVFHTILDSSGFKISQSVVVEDFLSKIPLHSCSIAFVKGKSYFDFLEPHRFGNEFLRLDVKSFFHSVDIDILRSVLSEYCESSTLSERSPQQVVDAVLNISTYDVTHSQTPLLTKKSKILPIGFSTSPVLGNIYMRPIDILISKFCAKLGVVYTRYADDLLFSCFVDRPIWGQSKNPLESLQFKKEIDIYLRSRRLSLNNGKTLGHKNMISLNGYVIEGEYQGGARVKNTIRLSDKKLFFIKKFVHELSFRPLKPPLDILHRLFNGRNGESYRNILLIGDSDRATVIIQNKILGFRSYLLSLVNYNTTHGCIDPIDVSRYLKLVRKLESAHQRYM